MWRVSKFLSMRFSMVVDLQEVLENNECADELKGGEYMEAESDRRRINKRELIWEVLVSGRKFDFVYILSDETGFRMPKDEVFQFLEISGLSSLKFSKKIKEAQHSPLIKVRGMCQII